MKGRPSRSVGPRNPPGRSPRRGRLGRLFAAVRLGRDTSGSVLPLVALSGLVLVGMTGLAIDGARLSLMHSKLQTAVDAAGLSAAAQMTTTNVDSEIDKFLNANFDQAYVGATITGHTLTLSSDEKTLDITANAEAFTAFMRIFGIDSMQTSAYTQVTRATGGLELSLVLDVTGSMGDNNKIGSLKTAANNLLDILFGDQQTAQNLYIGIVPFTQTVNIGSSHSAWLASTASRNWSGCVQMRFNGLDTTDAPPAVGKKFSELGSGTCPPEITGMTSSKSKLTTAIAKLNPNGGTNVPVGAVWGWRMLSPLWRGSWGGDMGLNLPLDYNTSGMSKAVVLMTDGKNEISSGSAYGEVSCLEYQTTWWWKTCVSYGYDARLGVSASNQNDAIALADQALDGRLTTICTNMKNAGIKVYTVALGNPGASIKSLLKGCATQPAFFFDSPTGEDLKTAFAKIGDSLSNLRLSR